jgi:hypothetical protein
MPRFERVRKPFRCKLDTRFPNFQQIHKTGLSNSSPSKDVIIAVPRPSRVDTSGQRPSVPQRAQHHREVAPGAGIA